MSARDMPARAQGRPAKRVHRLIRHDPQVLPQARSRHLRGSKRPNCNQQMATQSSMLKPFSPELVWAREFSS